MTITLFNRVYAIVRTMTGAPLVVVQQRRADQWRVASAEMTRRVLDGVTLEVVK